MGKIFNGDIALGLMFAPNGAQPIDDRAVVASLADLTAAATFVSGSTLYNGMMVFVEETSEVYVCIDKSNYTNTKLGWAKVGEGSGSITAATYADACALATADNLGQVIFVTTETQEGQTKYSSGPYIVSGAGAVMKLGTTSASGDLADELAALTRRVGDDEVDIEAVSGLAVANEANIVTVSGTAAQNAANITTVSGTAAQNAANIATVSGTAAQNADNIEAVSGAVDSVIEGAGLKADGSYDKTKAGAAALSATSLADADEKLYELINGAIEEAISVTGGTGIQVTGDGTEKTIAVKTETHTADTVAAGHVEVKANDNGELYGVMYYESDEEEEVKD